MDDFEAPKVRRLRERRPLVVLPARGSRVAPLLRGAQRAAIEPLEGEDTMGRMVLTDDTGRWFDTDKAKSWEEETLWNGNNHISKATGSQWEHETLYRTAGGIYVVEHTSQWQGSTPTVEEVSAEEAAVWLSRNDYDDAEDAGPEVAEAYAALELA